MNQSSFEKRVLFSVTLGLSAAAYLTAKYIQSNKPPYVDGRKYDLWMGFLWGGFGVTALCLLLALIAAILKKKEQREQKRKESASSSYTSDSWDSTSYYYQRNYPPPQQSRYPPPQHSGYPPPQQGQSYPPPNQQGGHSYPPPPRTSTSTGHRKKRDRLKKANYPREDEPTKVKRPMPSTREGSNSNRK